MYFSYVMSDKLYSSFGDFMKKLLSVLALLILLMLVSCAEEEYTVRFVYGDARADLVMTVGSGDELFHPLPSEDDYAFAGWFTDAALTRPYLSKYVDEDITLYARFIKKGEYAVTFIYENGDPSTTILMTGVLTEPTAPVREGYVFAGWKDAASGEIYRFGVPINESHTVLVATWRESSDGVRLIAHPENGSASIEYSYAYSAIPAKPATPSGDGEFLGWFADSTCKIPFDFSAPLTHDTHIYAGWGVNYKELSAGVVTELIPATVEVHTARRSALSTAISTGSGVIYSEDSFYYYILTNEHVVRDQSGFNLTVVSVVDAYGNEYKAERLAMSKDHDLAALRIAKGDKALSVASFASEDPIAGDFVISIGCPGSLNNAVTYGEVKRYGIFNVNGSPVSFEVGTHDAYLANGSSGGAVFNASLEVIGISFAASTDTSGEFVEGAFVQISRVVEFLVLNSLPVPK